MDSGSSSSAAHDSEKMEEDGKEEDPGSFVENGHVGAPDQCGINKEDSGILLDSCLSTKSEDESKSPSVSFRDASSDAEMNDSEWLHDSTAPCTSSSLSESGVDTKSEGGSPPTSKGPKQTSDSRAHIGWELVPNAGTGVDASVLNEDSADSLKESDSCEKCDAMSVGCEDQPVLDVESDMKSPQKSSSAVTENGSAGTSSPACKRVTTDEDDSPRPKKQTPDRWDDEDDSPRPKKQTPDRWDEEEEEETETADTGKTSTTSQGEQSAEGGLASEDVPNLSSDDNDGSSDSPRLNPRVYRRKRSARARRLARALRDSSSEDSSEDGAHNDNDKDSDDEDGEESNEEVKKAISDILNKPPPKPNWFAFPELKKREYGMKGWGGCSHFIEKVQGSLEMARRLVMVDQMKYHEGCVNALCFNRIGTLLASGSDDLNIVLWNWQRSRPSLIYDSGHRSNVFQAKFMPFSGDCHVISCARDGQVRLAELSLTGVCKATRKLANHRGAVHKLALEMDSANVFLSCGEDAVTFLFDLRDDKPHRLVTTKENEKKVPLYSIHSNPANSHQFCVGGRDHYIRVYDKRKIADEVNNGVLKKLCPDHLVDSDLKANVTCASYNYNGSEILGSYNDEDIYLFDNNMSDGANYIHRYTGHRNNATVKGVNFYGPKSEFIISGSDCGNIYFWDKETEAIINFQEGDDAGVINVLEPHPTLPILATSGLDHDVKLWMPSTDPLDTLDKEKLKKTLQKNHIERTRERVSEPEMMGGQMLWFLMHHFRNSARRRMRSEGYNVSSSDDDEEENNSDDEDASNEMQCAQS